MRKWLGLVALLAANSVFAQARTDTGAAWTHTAVTPSDTNTLTAPNGDYLCRALYIRTAGNIVIEDRNGTQITYAVADGTLLPFRPFRVRATGTTATNIVCWNN